LNFFENNIQNANDLIEILLLKVDELCENIVIATNSYAPNNSQLTAIRGSGRGVVPVLNHHSNFYKCSQKRFL
jgi:hypothetical protein